jgi:hypothetical protein
MAKILSAQKIENLTNTPPMVWNGWNGWNSWCAVSMSN